MQETRTDTDTRTHTGTQSHTQTHVNIHKYMHIHKHKHMYIFTNTCTQVHVYVHKTHANAHAHQYKQTTCMITGTSTTKKTTSTPKGERTQVHTGSMNGKTHLGQQEQEPCIDTQTNTHKRENAPNNNIRTGHRHDMALFVDDTGDFGAWKHCGQLHQNFLHLLQRHRQRATPTTAHWWMSLWRQSTHGWTVLLVWIRTL